MRVFGEEKRAMVALGPVHVVCEVARTAFEQAQGLQGHAPLGPYEGMIFPFSPPRASTFHMGSVGFPIDIVFADAEGCIGRIVHDAQPGTRSRWSHPVCGAVVELQGGLCVRQGVDLGQRIHVAQPDAAKALRAGASSYNPLRTIVEADPLMDGYYSKEPLGGDLPRDRRNPEDRFKDHRLPDESFSEAHDQPMDGFVEQYGYSPDWQLDGLVGPNVRMSGIEAPGQFMATLIEAMARQETAGQSPVPWQPDLSTNGQTESAVVTPNHIASWLTALGLAPYEQGQVLAAATSPSGMKTLADGFILAGLADRSVPSGNALVLTRGRKL